MLELRTLGTIDLREGSGRRVDRVLVHSKRISLLALLATPAPPGLHRRDTLIALLWPELDEAHARGALRHELYELRRDLGQGVVIGSGETVGVAPDRLWCDASALQAALDAGRLEEALELWRGEYLPGLHLDGGEFERWLDDTRDRLSRRMVEAGRTLIDRAESACDTAAAIAWARRLTDVAPWDETGWQRLIRLLDGAGDRSGALVAFETLSARLLDELQVEPAPETRALADRIRQRNGPVGDVQAAAGAGAPGAAGRAGEASPAAAGAAGEAPPAVVPAAVAPAGTGPGRTAHAAEAAPSPTRSRARLRTARLRLAAAVLPFLAVGILAFMLTGRSPGTSLPVIEMPTVENGTGDPSMEPLRRRIADRLAEGLLGTEFVELVAPGRRSGVTALVSATLYARGSAVEARARLTEPGRGGRVMAMPDPVLLSPADPDPGIDTLVARILAATAAHYDPRFEAAGTPRREIPTTTPSWQAYLAYVRGSDLFGHEDFERAATYLLEAYRLDPGFAKAAVFGAIALAMGGRPAAGDSLVSALLAGPPLREYDSAFARWFQADLRGRRAEAYAAAMDLMRAGRASSPSALAVAGREALRTNRPAEAIQLLRRVDISHGWLRHYTEYWEGWGAALHMVRDHRRELVVAEDARGRFRSSPATMRVEVRACAALHDAARALQVVGEALALPGGDGDAAGVAWVAAQELDAHGHAADAAVARGQAIEWLRSVPEPTSHEQLLLVRLLLESARVPEAAAAMAAVAPVADLEWLEVAGLLAAAAGDTAAAAGVIARLESLDNPYLSGRHLLLAAGIRAALHQPDAALETLLRAQRAGAPYGVELHALPVFRPLATDPRFLALLRPRG